jgi:uncharacterized protein with NAD-binding domain and iron-sulfur cluster
MPPSNLSGAVSRRPPTAAKTKVVVLGGGCGGIAAAFWLSSTPQLRQRFEVTIYTRGWRLGGKGASGRNPDVADRIEEHGLHMWLGCYENAFRTIRACYDEWQPRPGSPLNSCKDAFTPQRRVTFQQFDGGPGQSWTPWNFDFPQRPGIPGDGLPTITDLVGALDDWLAAHLGQGVFAHLKLDNLMANRGLLRTASAPGAGKAEADQAVQHLAALAAVVRPLLAQGDKLLSFFSDDAARDLIFADLALAFANGIATDILPFGDEAFDRLNAIDLRAWLSHHGATAASVNSAATRAVYDLGFAYPGGNSADFSAGRAAAGVAVRFLLEMAFGYKDAPLWKMNAGMGDTIFTPFFQVLQARGVRICFFHRLTRVDLTPDRNSVGAITLQRQADIVREPYQPLVPVGGLDCWPSQPLWDQLVNGKALRQEAADFESAWDNHSTATITLQSGPDFDIAVLAVPPEMIRAVAPDLSANNPVWKRMIDNSASVATQAFQLWLAPDTPALGWAFVPTVLTAYSAPFDTWADMSHLLPRESWPGPAAPRSIAYFCGAMQTAPVPDPPPPDPIGAATRRAERNAADWMKGNIARLWPVAALPDGTLKPGVVVSSFYRANIDPSELYVQTLPGSVQFRLAPGARVFTNLYVAGDWALTRFSGGCVESAVESGMLASQAICGEPISIAGQRQPISGASGPGAKD